MSVSLLERPSEQPVQVKPSRAQQHPGFSPAHLLMSRAREAQLPDDRVWRDLALCRHPDLRELFFPQDDLFAPVLGKDEEGRQRRATRENDRQVRIADALRVCAACPAWAGCVAYGLRLLSSDKVAIYGIPWNRRKPLLARCRRRMRNTEFDQPTVRVTAI